MKRTILALLTLSAALLAGCDRAERPTRSGLLRSDFQTTVEERQTDLYTLANAAGMEVCITPFGGRIVSIVVPDRDGEPRDVVLGFDNIEDYRTVPSDFGASIGRYANRIAEGRFTLDGVTYDLPKNNFGHCLHGGPEGWQYRLYEAEQPADNVLKLTLRSQDGEMGFPGAVTAQVTFTLTDDNALDIAYEAETDAPTVVNMTNHSYFNLAGDPSKTILNDVLQIDADGYTPVDSTYMTTGEILAVEDTPMDFRVPKTLGAEIGNFEFEQLRNGNGYDHNWVLNTAGDVTKPAAVLYSPASGIEMTLYTTEPGVQVYTGNFLDGTVTGKHGIVYGQRTGVCLETQKYPDTPNKPAWPSAVLRPGEKYESRTLFRFGVRD